MAPIRVTYVIPTLEIGGAETQLVRLVNALDRGQFRPVVVCPFGYGPLKSQVGPDVQMISLQLTNRRYSPGPGVSTVTRLRAAIIRLAPDIVHAYLMPAYLPAAYATWLKRPPVLIASRRGLDTYPRRRSRALRAMARLANRRIDFHLCNSEAVRAVVTAEEHIPLTKIAVIHNGIDLPRDISEGNRGAGDGRAAMVANFNDYKRHSDVLEAVRLVVDRRPGFELTLFGDGPERGRIERLIKDKRLERNVQLAGAGADAAHLLDRYDLTILASTKEGFPNALMESMARGVPVVATRVGGIPELVRDEVDGTLVDPGRPDQLAAAVLSLLESPQARRRMGEAARSRIRDSFTVEAMVTRTQDLYRRLLDK